MVADAAGLHAARADRPSVVVSAEGGDFLEGNPDVWTKPMCDGNSASSNSRTRTK
jgi:hypothetical protein